MSNFQPAVDPARPRGALLRRRYIAATSFTRVIILLNTIAWLLISATNAGQGNTMFMVAALGPIVFVAAIYRIIRGQLFRFFTRNVSRS